MRISATTLLIIVCIIGVTFMYLAVNAAKEAGSVWNVASIIFILIASWEFFYMIRILQFIYNVKKMTNHKK